MADAKHLGILKQGAEAWNKWRQENPNIEPDLSEADLTGAGLYMTDLYRANLTGANLISSYLRKANLVEANLYRANLFEADLYGANLRSANLYGADLTGAYLIGASLVDTDFTEATLSGCSIFGISAWELKLEGANQSDLVISRAGEPVITVDNLEVAQFIYLLLQNEKIRQVIDTITCKVVLILGRFSSERKAILDAIREELRKQDYLPVLFNFE